MGVFNEAIERRMARTLDGESAEEVMKFGVAAEVSAQSTLNIDARVGGLDEAEHASLMRAKKQLDDGILTQAQFDAKVKDILDRTKSRDKTLGEIKDTIVSMLKQAAK